MKTGVQQIMLGTVTGSEQTALETLKKIKAFGYDGIELNSFQIHPTSWLVRLLTKAAGMPTGKGGNFDWHRLVKESGLDVISLHTDLGSLKRDPAGIAKEAASFGTGFVVITGMYRFDYTSKAALDGLCRDLDQAGKALAAEGISLLYHNHNVEFLNIAGTEQKAYDYLLDHTDPAYVNFELDTFWPAEAGVDALSLMDRVGGRLKLWHVTDRGSRLTGQVMTPIIKSESVEAGRGNMPLKELAAKADHLGARAAILETHRNWVDKSPLKSIEISGAWMKEQIHE
ncbi:MAG: sugar phosphate isomerase/epimerase [Firmicutes bacterium]|nr:sugar phosphate isomerase/epimerase [Bacillota bacterium]